MGDVEEITDSRGEELTDKEQINLKESKVSVKTEAQAKERTKPFLILQLEWRDMEQKLQCKASPLLKV